MQLLSQPLLDSSSPIAPQNITLFVAVVRVSMTMPAWPIVAGPWSVVCLYRRVLTTVRAVSFHSADDSFVCVRVQVHVQVLRRPTRHCRGLKIGRSQF